MVEPNVAAQPPEPKSIWDKAKDTIIEYIGTAIAGGLVTACLAGAVAAWAVLKTWVIVEIPSGLVVASTVECRDLKGGWSAFAAAGGRFVIGAGAHPQHGVTKSYTPFTATGSEQTAGWEPATGGEERHLLTVDEMPSHTHSGFVGTGGASFERHQFNDRLPGTSWDKKTGATGGSQPHSIIPPYIALYYCKKN